jgi:hypothetical protein
MKLFNKVQKGSTSLFSKNTEPHSAFGKYRQRARQHEHSKAGHFIANKRNDLEIGVRREADNGPSYK